MNSLGKQNESAVLERNEAIVMFSGGRDSTLASLRLLEAGLRPILVTVTSNHLYGIEAVRRRVVELRCRLPSDTRWIQVRQPTNLGSNLKFDSRTCLPCQMAYAIVGAKVAKNVGSRRVAMGYVSYQSAWPEQTGLATMSLREVFQAHELELLLPVYDVRSKEDAVNLLSRYGVSTEALEQKCSRQVTNISLSESQLGGEIEAWKSAISSSLSLLDEIEMELLSDTKLKDL